MKQCSYNNGKVNYTDNDDDIAEGELTGLYNRMEG